MHEKWLWTIWSEKLFAHSMEWSVYTVEVAREEQQKKKKS